MASNDGDFEDEVLRAAMGRLSIQPYQFEPRVAELAESESSASRASSSSASDDEQHHEQPDHDPFGYLLGNTDWCECGNCVPMPTARESRCCRRNGPINNKVEEEGLGCILEHDGFDVNCLNSHVLECSFWIYSTDHGPIGDEEPLNELYRFIAYRRFVAWIWHKLGKKTRKILPSCVVSRIRAQWESPTHNYVGFKYPEQ